MKIGFVGVGRMGHGMASNLLEAGHDLTVIVHRNRAPVDDLVSKGAIEACDLADLAAKSECIFLCVTDAGVVESVIDGLRDHLTPQHLIIDTSTSDPVVTERLAADLKDRGVAYADSPVTGGPQQAVEGVLGAIVGADTETFERVKPTISGITSSAFARTSLGLRAVFR